ncbi:MAG: ABC transporter substrate-binding protein, partial [Candidatus Edwardsbacteria bacterium]|nr:ABC transporter substrate-binding protein [Candidatus Edwardsbacteria bacterium]
KFHNGERLFAGDVIFSLERAQRHIRSVFRGMLAGIDTIASLDSLTVEIRTKRPQPTLINILSLVAIIPKGHDPDRTAIGTGPYRFFKFLPGRGAELESNPDYWGKRPHFRRVEFRSIPDGDLRAKAQLYGQHPGHQSVRKS